MSKIQDGNTDYQKTSTIELQVAFSSSARKTTMYARKETMVRKKLSLITDTLEYQLCLGSSNMMLGPHLE